MRVVAETPVFSVDAIRHLLPEDVTVEVRPRPWEGDDIIGLLVWQGVNKADMERLPALRAIVTASIGVDHIDMESAKHRGLWVCNVPGFCADEVADTTMALLLSLLRGTVFLDRSVREGRWDDHAAGALLRVSDVKLGVIGFGYIGRAVARRAIGLGMETWATDPLIPPMAMTAAGVRAASFEEVLRNVMAVSIHVPMTKENRHLIGERELGMMPPGSFLVNTARGPLVDTAALIRALDDGHLAGAALDVLEVEPPSAAHPVPTHPRLIVTPHAAWMSERAKREVVPRAAGSMAAVLKGEVPEGLVLEGMSSARDAARKTGY